MELIPLISSLTQIPDITLKSDIFVSCVVGNDVFISSMYVKKVSNP